MIQGLYAAATGLMAVEERQAVTANNIANASSPGFKRQFAVQRGFYPMFSKLMLDAATIEANRAPGGGMKVIETFTDYRDGSPVSTGDPFQLALAGPGFMVVDTPQGERLTRSGDLMPDADGDLATRRGLKVQNSAGGTINVDGGAVSVDEDGTVRVDGQERGRIRMVEFPDPHVLTHEGESLFMAPIGNMLNAAPAGTTTVRHKMVEASNVNVPYEVVQMTLGLRAYAANQRVINAIDETASRLIEQVGTPV